MNSATQTTKLIWRYYIEVIVTGRRRFYSLRSVRLGYIRIPRIFNHSLRGSAIQAFREEWPDCDKRTYGGPFSTGDLRGTWDTK